MNFGLSRVDALLKKLSSPDRCLKIAHIAGTNGKGSIAEYLSRIIACEGKRVGTFTSPAVMSEWEQFRVNCEPIAPAVMSEYLDRCFALRGDCTAFEVLTAAALLAFKEQGCEYAVVECGLGGLNDATNAISHKEVAIISSIGLEHTAVLGNTIEEICYQKAGIVKDCPLIVNALQPDEALRFFKERNAVIAVPTEIDDKTQTFVYGGKRYQINYAGRVQIFNVATAIEAAHVLGMSERAIESGLRAAKLYGRMQVIRRNGNTYIVDGAHNPQAIGELAEFLGRFENVSIVYGSLSDKDIAENLRILGTVASDVTAVQPNSIRAMNIETTLNECKRHFGSVKRADSVSEALVGLSGTIAVCGSFTLVKEALNWIEKGQ